MWVRTPIKTEANPITKEKPSDWLTIPAASPARIPKKMLWVYFL